MVGAKVLCFVLLVLVVVHSRHRHRRSVSLETEKEANKEKSVDKKLTFAKIAKFIKDELENPQFNFVSAVSRILESLYLKTLKDFPATELDFFTAEEVDALVLDKEGLTAFVDRMVSCASQNPILHTMLDRLSDGWTMTEHASLKDNKFRAEIVPSAVAYAFVLDAMNRKIAQDPYNGLRILIGHYKSIRELHADWRKSFGLFPWSKLLAVEYALEQWRDSFEKYFDSHKKTQVLPSTGYHNIPLNIMEAMVADYWMQHAENAKAGYSLMLARPGIATHDAVTKAGPTELTDSSILYRYPFPVDWDNLYSSWNLAFVGQFPTLPHFFAKLLNPSVGCYYDDPNEYIFNRGISLYTHVHFVLLNRLHSKDLYCDSPVKYDFHELFMVRNAESSEKSFVDLWGEVNHAAGKEFSSKLKAASASAPAQPSWLWQKGVEFSKRIRAAISSAVERLTDEDSLDLLMADSFVLDDSELADVFAEYMNDSVNNLDRAVQQF